MINLLYTFIAAVSLLEVNGLPEIPCKRKLFISEEPNDPMQAAPRRRRKLIKAVSSIVSY